MLPIVTGVLAAHIVVDCLLQLQKVGICYMAFLRRGFCFYLDHAPRSCAMEYFSFAPPDIPILRLGVVFRIVRNNTLVGLLMEVKRTQRLLYGL